MFTIKQSYNQMKYVQHYLWDGILFLLISWTVSSRAKGRKGRGEAVAGVLEEGAMCQGVFTISPQVIKSVDSLPS